MGMAINSVNIYQSLISKELFSKFISLPIKFSESRLHKIKCVNQAKGL